MTIKEPITGTMWNSDSAPENPARTQMRQVGTISSSATRTWTTMIASSSNEPSPSNQAISVPSDKRHQLDLDQHVARQARHFDGRASRRMCAEILRLAIDVVHGGKVVHVLD